MYISKPLRKMLSNDDEYSNKEDTPIAAVRPP